MNAETANANTAEAADPRYLIHLAKTQVREGYRTADVERILASYSDDLYDQSEGWPSFDGLEAKQVRRARLHDLFAKNEVSFTPVIAGVLVFDKVAIAYGWHELSLAPKDGSSAFTTKTRFMEMWRLESDGQWRIAMLLDNTDHFPMLAEEVVAALQASSIGSGSPGSVVELLAEPRHQPVAEP